MFGSIGEKVVVGVLTTIALAALYAAWGAIVDLRNEIGVPKGAVVAFDDPLGCPKIGWEDMSDEWKGHVLVAAVDTQGDPFLFRKTGGSAKVTLDEKHIPEHSHSYSDAVKKFVAGTRFSSGTNFHEQDDTNSNRLTHPLGREAESFSIMQPYVPLYFCKKL